MAEILASKGLVPASDIDLLLKFSTNPSNESKPPCSVSFMRKECGGARHLQATEGGGTEGARGVLEFALKPFARWERRLLKMMLEPDPTKRPPVGLLLHFLQDGTPSSEVKIPAYNNGERES